MSKPNSNLDFATFVKLENKNSVRIVCIGDLHAGSMFALADPSCSPTDDQCAIIRKRIFEKYKAATRNKDWKKPDILFVMGDCVEGQNKKSNGIGLWTTDLLRQADHATHLIKMWDAKNIIMVRGSGYHVGAGGSGLQVEELIARNLNATHVANQSSIPNDMRDKSAYDWYININGYTFHMSHKIAVSKVFHYQSTPTARQMLQARLNDALRDAISEVDLRIKCVLRGHAHYFNTVGYSSTDGFVCPCWKCLDEFMEANGPIDISPDLGFLGFEVDRNGKMRYDKRYLFRVTDAQKPNLVMFG